MESPSLQVAVVAADPLVRRGLVVLLEAQPDLQVLTSADDLALAEADVLLWDGEAALEPNEPSEAQTPILALVSDVAEVASLLATGARSALYRDATDGQLIAAIRATAEGLAVLEPEFTTALAAAAAPPNAPVEALTPREQEVLELLAEGLANKAIARRLELSEHTVKFHLSALLSKFGVRTRTALVVRALQEGYVRV